MASTNFVDFDNSTPIVAAWLNDVNRTQYTILGNPADRAGYIALDTAHAGGTADAITAAFSVSLSALTDGLIYRVRSSAANATATPTFTPNAGVITPAVIVRQAGVPLLIGDIPAAGYWMTLQYDATLAKWVLLNPGALEAGKLGFFARTSAPSGWLKANGSGVLVASYAALTAAIYCGDANNATAEWGYRATDSAGTTRSTTGSYLILPDFRGRFPRAWADGSTLIDSGRSLWASQADGASIPNFVGILVNNGTGSTVPAASAGGTYLNGPGETRPANLAALVCIKY